MTRGDGLSADEILRRVYDSTNEALKVGITVLDDKRFKIGTSEDVSIVLNSAGLSANTALANVLEGTPVTPAIAANSLIISNVTDDGDILIAVSDGGNSKAGIWIDASVPYTYLYNGILGGTLTLNGQILDAGSVNALINTTGKTKGLFITSTQDDNEGARIDLVHLSASPANGDRVAQFRGTAYDAGKDSQRLYGMMDVIIEDVTDDAWSGSFKWWTGLAGTANTAMTLSGAGDLWTDASVDTLLYKVSGTQVVSAQGAAVADATDAASAITQLNALLARCRTHGLIAT